VAAIEEELAGLPGVNIAYTQPIELRMNELAAGIRSDVGVKIYGDDLDELVRLSNEVQRVLAEIPGASGISADQVTGQPTLEVAVDPGALARYGVASSEVLDYIEALGGKDVGDVYEGQRVFPLVVRLSEVHRDDPEALAEALVATEAGHRLELGQLASLRVTDSPATINREWSRRLIRVQSNVRGRDVGSFVDEARRRVAQEVDLPEGYVIDWGGQFEHLERARLRLSVIVPFTLLLVFFVLYFSLKSLRDVLIIYTGVPFAVMGGVFALWWRGIPFSVSAAIGFIALSGLAVLNGQVLVAAVRSFRNEGLSLGEAVVSGGKQRLRPVLATAITDAAGFIPMALSTGMGAEVQRPLATVVIGGVITDTALTLLVLPLLYWLVHRRER
jgi:cobalt-zinc-cadmium resistance protein CzcA